MHGSTEQSVVFRVGLRLWYSHIVSSSGLGGWCADMSFSVVVIAWFRGDCPVRTRFELAPFNCQPKKGSDLGGRRSGCICWLNECFMVSSFTFGY